LIVHSLRSSLNGPVDIFAAHGHGRSYCQWSYFFHRGLPPILDCGIWSALESQAPADMTWGIITDIGNDLLYGVPLDRVIDQIARAFQRLADLGARITFVRPPMERILMLSAWRYRATCQVLYPGCRVSWAEMSVMIRELDEQIAEMAASTGATVIVPKLEWYGIDPIHVRRSKRPLAWQHILETWPFAESPVVRWPSLYFAQEIWRATPAERTLWKRASYSSQPSWQTADGPTLWLF
jgi:hypothetical protein